MATTHTCYVDCQPFATLTGGAGHMMHAAEPSSAAGRYQWEQNARIKRQGRRAWRATGQGQSRACREWDHARSLELAEQAADGVSAAYLDRVESRARGRHLRALLMHMPWE